MEPSDHTVHSGESQHHHHIRLACQACQRKKIKCDRTFPCGQCQRSDLQCLPSTRKPRARHAASGKRAVDSELRSRISKLESLVESLSGGPVAPDAAASPSDGDTAESPIVQHDLDPPVTLGKYIGSPFWATLTNEVQSLRDALEEDTSDEEPELEQLPPAQDSPHDLLICSPSTVFVMPGALPEPPPQMLAQLYDIFLRNVDPVFKVLHRPTIQRFLAGGETYLDHAADSPPARALKAAMWFAAVTTLTDADCITRFPLSNRSDLLQLYRRHVDVALAYADLINTRDIPTLQACVLYTTSARISDPSRRPWTMTGLIVRIAYGMNLHKEVLADSPYFKEIKRRLWHQIRVLDAFAAVDRGTALLIVDTSDTPLPSNVNDSEFDESSTFVPNREYGLSDTTFSLMAYSACSLTMRFLTPEVDGTKGQTWQQRLDLALDLGKKLRVRYLQHCDLTKPFHRFIYVVGNSMAASSVLRAVRPMQRHVSSIPPRVDSPFVLQLAVNSMQASDATHDDPEAEGWRWVFWVQWHALAVALAGLCSIRDTELANTAWKYAEKSYERHSRHIADTRGGMLWRPIEKLYKTACAFRDGKTPPHKAEDHHNAPHRTMSELRISPPSTSLPFSNGLPDTIPGNGSIADMVNQPMVTIPFDVGLAGVSPLQVGDMTWMDFERIMEDFSASNLQATGGPAPLENMQAPPNFQDDWPYPPHHDLM